MSHLEKSVKTPNINESPLSGKELLAIVSHDIKNPLSAIQLEAQMLLKAADINDSSLSQTVRLQAGRILKTTQKMKGLVSDLLESGKKDNQLAKLKRIDFNVVRVLEEALDAVRPLLEEKQIAIHYFSPSGGITANFDLNKMYQVFGNLLNNAIKFTPEGGMIHLEWEDSDRDFSFRIMDSGPGMRGETSKVFDKYWTSDDSEMSSGLGLYICKTIIEAHDGAIWAQNSRSGGATFSFKLPKTSPDYKGDSTKKKIFIIDDDEDLGDVISWALEQEGFKSHTFQSPGLALEILQESRELPHLIVVDFQMDQMKGSDFLIRKNEIPSLMNCPVIVMSASPQEAKMEARSDLYKEVITKPIDLTGLVALIRNYLS